MQLQRFVQSKLISVSEIWLRIRLQLCDFLRFGVKYAEELYNQQPPKNSAGVWK